ncbi:MAG TPA: serine/threonine protein phosphatase [Ruminiclostridium sp.]|nr:LysM peptidoglycan-binding domain-containing protein [Clostridiaceae bacterium]HAA26062.1 serine/threonine protein phosphatase [Ruminiclostridium sp.]
MSDVIKINACVYSRIGYERDSNRDDFYMNGKFLSEHHLDNMQASMENRGTEFFFAVADHMEFSDDEQRASFSILREVGKYHEKISVHEGDLDFKTRELASRVQETGKYLDSFLDMRNAPDTDPARQMGFAGLLLSDGKAVGSTYGTCHIYLCRGNVFKHMTDGSSRSKRLVDLGIISDEEAQNIQEKYKAADEDEKLMLLSEPVELMEGDKFLLISDGVYNALGEEYLEDILSMRSDSTYIAYRIITEAAKRSSDDDMTAMVVRIERVSYSTGTVKKSVERSKVSALKKSAPPPSFKYKNRGGIKKYENLIYYGCVVLTAILLILIVVLLIKNIYKRLNEIEDITPDTSINLTVTPPPGTDDEPVPDTTPEATPEATPEPTPEPTQAEIREYTVKPGDTLSSIAREFYGDNWVYVERLGRYNKIPAPYDSIIVGQVLKIPPKEVLNAQE